MSMDSLNVVFNDRSIVLIMMSDVIRFWVIMSMIINIRYIVVILMMRILYLVLF